MHWLDRPYAVWPSPSHVSNGASRCSARDTAQLYGVELTAANAAVLVLATVLGTFVGSGMPTIPFLNTLTIVAQPMGFPVEPIIPIFLAILPVLDPFGTAAGVTLHAAAASVIIGRTQAVSDEAEPTEAAPSPGAPATAS